MVAGSAVLAYLAIRSLGLPTWWILWAPILDGSRGKPRHRDDGAADRGRWSAFGVRSLLKIYAVLPMAGERRWRALVAAAGLVAITIPILPWDKFFADLAQVEATLVDQNLAGSAWVLPILVPFFAVGLGSLGLRRAGYLAVPVLWPRPQLHYSALILPVASTSLILTIGFGVGFIISLAPLLSVASTSPSTCGAVARLSARTCDASWTTFASS